MDQSAWSIFRWWASPRGCW